MNIYKGRYKEFIEGIMKERPMNEKLDNSQRHHVVPICCDGIDNDIDNIRVYLKYSEHFIAHKILAQDNPHNYKLVCAWWRMCNGREECTPEDYELARVLYKESGIPESTRKKMSESAKIRVVSEETRKKMSLSQRGRKCTLEQRARMSEAQKGNKNNEGRSLSKETKEKISLALKGKPKSDEHIKHNSDSRRGKTMPPRVYHLICKSCGSEFIAKGPTVKYCINCK